MSAGAPTGSAPIAAAPAARRIALSTKLVYGLGSIAYGVKDNGFSTLLLLFYNQVVGLPAELVGVAIFFALVLDAVIDPVIGRLSDRLRSPWGRRHPFMYAAALPVGLLYLLIWNPPLHAPRALIVVYLVVVAVLTRTAISCYEVPSSALAAELTVDYHERTSISGFRYLFGWVGGMGMLLLTFTVLLAPSAHYPVGQLNPAGYRHYAVVASILMTATILISALGTHRQIRHLPQLPAASTSLGGMFKGVGKVLRNRAFAILMISGVFSYTAQGLNFALSTYFNTFLWGLPASWLAVFTACVIAGVAAAFVLSTYASRRLGKRDLAVGCGVAYVVLACAPYLLRLAGLFPSNQNPWLLPLLMGDVVLATLFSVGGFILGASMMADVVEDGQARTGERAEGLFFAGSFFMQKCVSGFGLFLSGLILSAVRFPAAAVPGTVPHSVLDHLSLTYCVCTIVLGLISAFAISRFAISQADHERRVLELADIARRVSPLPGSEPELGSTLAPATPEAPGEAQLPARPTVS